MLFACQMLVISQVFAATASTPLRLPHFIEVTKEAGLDFRYVNGASGRKYMVEPMGSGAAFFDADNDGWLDLYIVNGTTLPGYQGPPGYNAYYCNQRDGTFVDATAAAGTGDDGYGMGVAVGDYDNDGDLDLYVANYGPNVLYRNDGNGAFTDVTASAAVGDSGWSTHTTFVDYDRDGDLDLYVSNYMAYSLTANKKCYAGAARSFCGPTTYPGQSGVLYRNDVDLHSSTATTHASSCAFTDVTVEAGLHDDSGRQLASVFGDYDGDGDPDLFIANDKRPNFLFINNGDGTFTENGAGAGTAYNEDGLAESAMGADLGDYDNDGRLDIILATFQWLPNTLYHNDGDGFFTDVTFAAHLGVESVPYLGMTAAFLDYDNDGYLDIFLANGHLDENVQEYDPSATYAQRNQLFHNSGNGVFADVSRDSGPGMLVQRVSHGAAFGDYDNDGDVDIFVSDSDTPHCTLLRNEGGNQQHYLILRAVGVQSNREGIGARIRAVAGDLVQTREIRRGYGYMGSSDVRLILGLGAHAQVDTLVIRWPSGAIQTLHQLAANQTLVVTEASD